MLQICKKNDIYEFHTILICFDILLVFFMIFQTVNRIHKIRLFFGLFRFDFLTMYDITCVDASCRCSKCQIIFFTKRMINIHPNKKSYRAILLVLLLLFIIIILIVFFFSIKFDCNLLKDFYKQNTIWIRYNNVLFVLFYHLRSATKLKHLRSTHLVRDPL